MVMRTTEIFLSPDHWDHPRTTGTGTNSWSPSLGFPPTYVSYRNTVVQLTPWTSRCGNVPLNPWLQTPNRSPFPSNRVFGLLRTTVPSPLTVLPRRHVSTADSTSFPHLPRSWDKSLALELGASINFSQFLVPCQPMNSPLDNLLRHSWPNLGYWAS